MKTITFARRTLNADLFRSVFVRVPEDKTVTPRYSVEAVFGQAKLYLGSFNEKPAAQEFTQDIASQLQFVGISVINAGSGYFRTDAVVEVRESGTEDGDTYLEITLDDGSTYVFVCDVDQMRALHASITAFLETGEVPQKPTPIV